MPDVKGINPEAKKTILWYDVKLISCVSEKRKGSEENITKKQNAECSSIETEHTDFYGFYMPFST